LEAIGLAIDSAYEYKHPDHLRFVSEMEEAGLESGITRAVSTGTARLSSSTTSRTPSARPTSDASGTTWRRGWVVYPLAYDYEAGDPPDLP
jgi:hypothetical protein